MGCLLHKLSAHLTIPVIVILCSICRFLMSMNRLNSFCVGMKSTVLHTHVLMNTTPICDACHEPRNRQPCAEQTASFQFSLLDSNFLEKLLTKILLDKNILLLPSFPFSVRQQTPPRPSLDANRMNLLFYLIDVSFDMDVHVVKVHLCALPDFWTKPTIQSTRCPS